MQQEGTHWLQRFSNFKKAFVQLEKGVKLSAERPLSELENQKLIQVFEFTHKLAWNVTKDYFEYQGNPNLTGSRDTTRETSRMNLIVKATIG